MRHGALCFEVVAGAPQRIFLEHALMKVPNSAMWAHGWSCAALPVRLWWVRAQGKVCEVQVELLSSLMDKQHEAHEAGVARAAAEEQRLRTEAQRQVCNALLWWNVIGRTSGVSPPGKGGSAVLVHLCGSLRSCGIE